MTAHYRSSDGNLKSLQEKYPSTRLQTTKADLTKEEDVMRMFSDALMAFGVVQVVVVNHGVWPTAHVPVREMSLERWNATILDDLTSPFLVCRAYFKQLVIASEEKKAKAAIILVGSTAGKYGEAGHADYAACKSGAS